MMRAVLDTNILASGFVRLFEPGRPLSIPAALIMAWSGGLFTLILSEAILGELDRTLRQGYFPSRISPDDVTALIDMLRADALPVEPPQDIRRFAPHATDDLILGTAVAGRADYLVTGDYRLRRMGAFRGIQLVSPQTFLDVLQADDAGATPPTP